MFYIIIGVAAAAMLILGGLAVLGFCSCQNGNRLAFLIEI